MRELLVLSGTVMYHGSVRLYQIHCFIRRHWKLLQTYLREPLTSDTSRVSVYVWRQLQSLYDTYQDTLHVQNPVTKEVMYLATVHLLVTNGVRNVSVYSVWNQLLSEDDQDVFDLLNFANDVEERIPGMFHLVFYSTMRLPVQFFTLNYESARGYASRNPDLGGAVYRYQLNRGIRLLDYDDRQTLTELGETVYASQEPFSEEVITYYTGSFTLAECRYAIMRDTVYILKGDHLVLLETLGDICQNKSPYFLSHIITYPKGNPLRHLAEEWFTYLTHDLLTPHHLWRLSNYFDSGRITTYPSDALLLSVLVENGEYTGYKSDRNSELLIIDPQAYGTMNTLSVETDEQKCSYAEHYQALQITDTG